MTQTRYRGRLSDWQPTRKRQKGIAADLIGRYEQHAEEGTLPRSPRGIFYDLRPTGLGNGITYRKPDSEHPIKAKNGFPGFDKDTEAYPAAVGEVLGLLRRAEIIQEDWVADTRAPDPIVADFYDGARDFAKHVPLWAKTFTLDGQRGQPVFMEVLCEAAGLQARLARIASDFGVPVFSGAGFDGIKAKRAFAERAQLREVPTVILNVGDFDKHGEYIYVAAAEDAIAWAKGGKAFNIGKPLTALDDLAPGLNFFRLALTEEQAIDLDILDADGKAEADGIPVPTMDAWLREAIELLQDPDAREELLAEEEQQHELAPAAIREALDDAA